MSERIWRQTLGDVLRRSAARLPGKSAILCGAVEWSYAELDAVCNRLAAGLHEVGVGMGTRVAILARNSHAYVAVRFALAKLGAVLVPVNFMLRDHEVAHVLTHSGATLLCSDAGLLGLARSAAAMGTAVGEILLLPDEDATPCAFDGMRFEDLLSADAAPIESDVRPDSIAQIVYTSGTESLPKGAMLTHAALLWEYVSCLVDAQIAETDRMLHAMPLYHCAQLDTFLGPAIYVGASNVITSKPAPAHLLRLLAAHAVSSFFCPPTVWIGMLRLPQFGTTDLTALRKGYYGASAMPVEILRELLARVPAVRFWNLYGQTEIAPLAAVLKPEDQIRKAGAAGKAALNVEIRIVDDEGRDVPVGEVGEIVHRSPQLLRAYFDDEARTREAFRGDWFHSGDLAKRDAEGYMTVVDRKKDMIKSGGENVASREVEEALYAHPAVAEAAVIGVPHERWVEAVFAVVVLKSGQTVGEQALIEHCRERLAAFKAPKGIVFEETLPKNPSGKVLKRDLRERYANALREK